MERLVGVINGKHIELEREIGLPPGSAVVVNIEPRSLSLEAKLRMVKGLCGAWAADASIPAIFEDIERRRETVLPREVNFDATS